MNAILLAGGHDTHLVPTVHGAPKALLPVVNRPMVEHLLQHLKSTGFGTFPAVNGNSEGGKVPPKFHGTFRHVWMVLCPASQGRS